LSLPRCVRAIRWASAMVLKVTKPARDVSSYHRAKVKQDQPTVVLPFDALLDLVSVLAALPRPPLLTEKRVDRLALRVDLVAEELDFLRIVVDRVLTTKLLFLSLDVGLTFFCPPIPRKPPLRIVGLFLPNFPPLRYLTRCDSRSATAWLWSSTMSGKSSSRRPMEVQSISGPSNRQQVNGLVPGQTHQS
jgi:hypothetical protein